MIGRRLAIGFIQSGEIATQMLVASMPYGPQTGVSIRVDTGSLFSAFKDFDACTRVCLFEMLKNRKQSNDEEETKDPMISEKDFLLRENELEMIVIKSFQIKPAGLKTKIFLSENTTKWERQCKCFFGTGRNFALAHQLKFIKKFKNSKGKHLKDEQAKRYERFLVSIKFIQKYL